jgi:hypothetical protein
VISPDLNCETVVWPFMGVASAIMLAVFTLGVPFIYGFLIREHARRYAALPADPLADADDQWAWRVQLARSNKVRARLVPAAAAVRAAERAGWQPGRDTPGEAGAAAALHSGGNRERESQRETERTRRRVDALSRVLEMGAPRVTSRAPARLTSAGYHPARRARPPPRLSLAGAQLVRRF